MDEDVIVECAKQLLKEVSIPSAVYRLQMNRNFPFRKAAKLAPYLKALGIEALYCSPYFEAVPGSAHGYDMTAPTRLNPDLGLDADFDAFCDALSKEGLGHILDFVANHMSATSHNPWWADVLKKGEHSLYAEYFDLEPNKKIHLPLLKEPLVSAIESKAIYLDGSDIVIKHQRLPTAEGTDLTKPLSEILDQQNYVLCDWTKGGSYRRFFDIAELAAVRQENPEVFVHYHNLALELALEGRIQGLRVDHPDGLYEPKRYFEDLQSLYFLQKLMQRLQEMGHVPDVDACFKVITKLDIKKEKPLYLLAEKILSDEETLPEELSVHGTVGYDFLARVGGVFVDQTRERAMTRLYVEYSGQTMPPDEMLYQQKKDFLLTYMSSELDRLEEAFQGHREALVELLASFPVYRTYLTATTMTPRDQKLLESAFEKAEQRAPDVDFAALRQIFPAHPGIYRFQQLSATLMAKGQEDTFFYVYNRLISLNEVGSNPMRFGTSVNAFHTHNLHRLKFWPYGLIATDTHDAKRSLDTRMRINVLSEIPEEWSAFLASMPVCPDPNFGYHFYQTLLGLFEPSDPNMLERLLLYATKAMREAKTHTSWYQPNLDYEEKIEKFVKQVFEGALFYEFWKRIDALGKQNSLSALVLAIGSPGVFDLYQGSELWRYAVVDPDNRRFVDFDQREALLNSSHPKLSLLKQGLTFRKKHKKLVLDGEYIPLKTSSDCAIAFARASGKQKCIFAARRFFTRSRSLDIKLPKGWKGPWKDLFSGAIMDKPTLKDLPYVCLGLADEMNKEERMSSVPTKVNQLSVSSKKI